MDKGLMSDATSTDESPVSGFQLSEISKATKSSYQANTQIQQYLVERLGKPHHNTKFKALMIIKHVCRTGRPEFKREMGRNVDAIRECLQFKGPPDPLRGDEIYRRVRECAKEVLEALFDGQMPVTTSAVAAANRIQGLGNDFTPPETAKPTTGGYLSSIASAVSSAVMGEGENSPKYAGHPGASGNFASPGAMNSAGFDGRAYGGDGGTGGYPSGGGGGGGGGGFGNPNFQDPRNEKTWMQRASALASTAASVAGFGKSETNEPLNTSGGGGGGGGGFAPRSSGTFNRAAFSNPDGGSGGFNRAAFSNPEGAGGGYNYASNRGPNAIHAHSSAYEPQAYSAGPANPQPFVPDMPVQASGFGRAGGGLDNGNYEKSLIDGLCEPGGLRPVPPEDQLNDFLNTASTLNEDIVGNCLLDVLNDEAWQARTKALIVLARLVKQPDCDAHRHFWINHIDVVEALQSDAKANVRTQAAKTLRSIDPTVVTAPATATAPVRRVSSGRGGFGAPVPVAAPVPVPDNVSEMGTTITEDDSQAISEDPAPVRERTPPPPPVVEMDLLDMDDLAPSSGIAMQGGIPSVVNISSQQSVSPLAHEFTAGPPTPSSTAVVAPVSTDTFSEESLFAGLSVGPAAVQEPVYAAPPAPAPAPPAAISAFDFLDASVSTESTMPTTSAPPVVNLFGSMSLVDVPVPAPAPSVQPVAPTSTAPPSMASGSRTLADEFAGLMDPAAAPAVDLSGGLTAGYAPYPQAPPQQMQQQQQQMTPEQYQQMMLMGLQAPRGPPPPGANAQGLYLTRPAPAQPAYGYAYPPRGSPGMPVPMPMPMAGRPMMPPGAMPMGMGMPGMAPMGGMGPRGGPMPVGGSPQPAIQLRQGASVIAPGMLSHTAERKNIPIAEGAGGSGFGFMGGNSGKQATSGTDSFSFVADAMKAQK